MFQGECAAKKNIILYDRHEISKHETKKKQFLPNNKYTLCVFATKTCISAFALVQKKRPSVSNAYVDDDLIH